MGRLAEVLDVLERTAEEIRSLEAQARAALFESDDSVAYEAKLREKTYLLMELPETLEPLLKEVEANAAEAIRAKAVSFARRAEPALSLSSTFYMSALLYPDDYKEGGKNDLEKFIAHLKTKHGL